MGLEEDKPSKFPYIDPNFGGYQFFVADTSAGEEFGERVDAMQPDVLLSIRSLDTADPKVVAFLTERELPPTTHAIVFHPDGNFRVFSPGESVSDLLF